MTYGIDYGISGNINIGRLNKTGTEFITKEAHTIPAALTVARWVLGEHNGEVDLTPTDGSGPGYRISVEKLEIRTPGAAQDTNDHDTTHAS